MNSYTPLNPTGPSPESTAQPAGSPASSGSRDTADPFLAVDHPNDARDMLVRPDLTMRQRQHLSRVALQKRTVVRVGKPKQDPADYWERRYAGLVMRQLVREGKKVKSLARQLVRRLTTIHKESKFRAALEQEQEILIRRIRALHEELAKRKVVSNGPESTI